MSRLLELPVEYGLDSRSIMISITLLNIFWIICEWWCSSNNILFTAFLGYKNIFSYYYTYSLVEM